MKGGGHRVIPPEGWTDRPGAVRWFFRSFFGICFLLGALELFVARHSEHPHPWEGTFLFYPLAGFISFWGLVIVAKGMRKILIRPEDYYDPTPESRALGSSADAGEEEDARAH